MKSLIDILIPNFRSCYKPSRDIAVDETMVGFRGRFGAKQYMPNKPVKYGIKAFMAMCSMFYHTQAEIHCRKPALSMSIFPSQRGSCYT